LPVPPPIPAQAGQANPRSRCNQSRCLASVLGGRLIWSPGPVDIAPRARSGIVGDVCEAAGRSRSIKIR
jgi:hypothetical protein